MTGKYHLETAVSGEFMFNLLAGNHPVILTSETYNAKQAR